MAAAPSLGAVVAHLMAAMVDLEASVAQGGTAAEVGVEPVEDVDAVLELAQLAVAERRLERPADVALIRDAGAQLVVRDLNPAVEQYATVAARSGIRSASTWAISGSWRARLPRAWGGSLLR